MSYDNVEEYVEFFGGNMLLMQTYFAFFMTGVPTADGTSIELETTVHPIVFGLICIVSLLYTLYSMITAAGSTWVNGRFSGCTYAWYRGRTLRELSTSISYNEAQDIAPSPFYPPTRYSVAGAVFLAGVVQMLYVVPIAMACFKSRKENDVWRLTLPKTISMLYKGWLGTFMRWVSLCTSLILVSFPLTYQLYCNRL